MSNKEDSSELKLEGYWVKSSSKYMEEITKPPYGACPVLDESIEYGYQPYALGSHILIKEDSISIFNYPYEYFGTYKYEIDGDSLNIEHDHYFPHKFKIQKSSESSIHFSFNENFTSTCRFISKAEYNSFNPNKELISKLIRDSISCDSLIGKWWYLRKEINHNDGSDITILNFPKGMPDSIYITEEIINQDIHKPFVELKLNNQATKLYFKSPSKNEFYLEPEIEDRWVWFAELVNYDNQIDTNYYDVIYRNY